MPTEAPDVALVVGAHLEADLLVALDPLVCDPLPIGISVFFKHADIEEARRSGWQVWERDNVSGMRRRTPRTELGVETVLALAPERMLDAADARLKPVSRHNVVIGGVKAGRKLTPSRRLNLDPPGMGGSARPRSEP